MIPQGLILDERYAGMSSLAKLTYAVFKDRLNLSIRNGWINKDGEPYIYFSNDDIQKIMRLKERQAYNIMKELKDFNLIDVVKRGYNKPQEIYLCHLQYPTRAVTDEMFGDNRNCKKLQGNEEVTAKNCRTYCKKLHPNNTDMNQTESNSHTKDIMSGSGNDEPNTKKETNPSYVPNGTSVAKATTTYPSQIKEVIDYLNEKTGKHFRANAYSNVKHITARLREGYAVSDFKTVIDKKCSQWKNDSKMKEYLRPETLFAGKFDRYLNEEKTTFSGRYNNHSPREEWKPTGYVNQSAGTVKDTTPLDINDEDLPF